MFRDTVLAISVPHPARPRRSPCKDARRVLAAQDRRTAPSAELAFGVRHKLTTYALAPEHPVGGPKARGFATILSITAQDVDHLVDEVENGVLTCGVSAIRANPPYGYLCEVKVPVRGLRRHSERRVDVVTSWELLAADAAPRLVTAYIKG